MKVSVVIPVYNVGVYIHECLDSVRTQTLSDIEILCIDDCGTDGSWEAAEKAAEEDSRIRLIRNETNMGLASSRNRGLDLARGEYVYFLDADDRILPEALEELYNRAKDGLLDAAVFCASFLYEDPELEEKFHRNPAVFKAEYPEVLSGKELYARWMEVWDWMPSQPRYFYRLAFLRENGIRFPDGILHEDEIFAFDVLMHAERVRAFPEKWFIRRFRRGSIMTGKATFKNVGGCIRILQHIAASADQYRDDERLSRGVDFYRAKIAENARGKFREACGSYMDLKGLGASGTMTGNRFHVSEDGPKISVLIPVYNVEPWLEDCLQSVLSQSLFDLEVICVDDASTDGSLSILSRYENMDPRVQILRHPENRGQASARNMAAACARGKYIYMLDADDYIEPDSLQTLFDLCEKDSLDVIAFENRQFADSDEFLEQASTVLFSYETTEGLYEGGDAFITCVEQDTLSPSVPTFMLRRGFVEDSHLRFTEGILHEDIGFIFEMLTRAERVRLLHRPFFCRRFRAHSTVTGGFSVRHAEGYLRSWQTALDNREFLVERFGSDAAFWHAYRKWLRDVAGRIRVLYSMGSDPVTELLHPGNISLMGSDPITELLRQTTPVRARVLDIFGEETCRRIEECGVVYICGSGQYAHRTVDCCSVLEAEVRGILEAEGAVRGKKTFRGFRVLDPAEGDRKIPVILAVSHYRREPYEKILSEAGYQEVLTVKF